MVPVFTVFVFAIVFLLDRSCLLIALITILSEYLFFNNNDSQVNNRVVLGEKKVKDEKS